MQNVRCSVGNRECPEGLDTCCQFCELNYTPCSGKCDGCWNDESVEICYAIDDRIATVGAIEAAPTLISY